MKKRHYSTEFKLEAIRLSYKRDTIKELAMKRLFQLVKWPYQKEK